jgi:hypothetical protein
MVFIIFYYVVKDMKITAEYDDRSINGGIFTFSKIGDFYFGNYSVGVSRKMIIELR